MKRSLLASVLFNPVQISLPVLTLCSVAFFVSFFPSTPHKQARAITSKSISFGWNTSSPHSAF